MKSELCDVLGIEVPIISAPLGGATGPEMTAAVSEAGGFGTIPLWRGGADVVHSGIEQVRALTDRNFAVNLNMDFSHEEELQACIDQEILAVSLFWGVKPSFVEMAKRGGLLVFSTVGSAEEAKIAANAGADVIVAQGWEAGGHVWGQVTTMALVPAVVDAVTIPVVAAGGISDGRAMAAALMLGASGVWVGTRFLASNEATIHPEYKQRILDASEEQTHWAAELYNGFWPDAPHRALLNTTSKEWEAAGCPKPGQRPGEQETIGQQANGDPILRYQSHTPNPQTSGDISAMSLWSGQGVSQVTKTQSAAEIVDEIYQDAMRTISKFSDLRDQSS
ncbi:MAG: NAD(P)H-dependent flavin oxidoreductase [Hyphomicrobiales bacterium]